MCKKNRWLLPVFFAGMVLLPMALLLCLQTTQYFLKRTADERLEQNKLHTIALPAASVIWEEEGRELQIDGRFFDVKHLERQGEMLLLTGHFDDIETDLHNFIQNVLHRCAESRVFSRLLLLLQCLVALPLIQFFLPRILIGLPHKRQIQAHWKNPFIARASLPPWKATA